jgi:hypothetical protein
MFRYFSSKAAVLGVLALAMMAGSSRPAMAQHAHEHGVAEVGVAVDGKTAQIEFTAPGSAIMGFEHEAKTDADKKKMADAFAKFKANAATMFAFDAALGCSVTTKQIGVAEEHDHDHDHDAKEHKHDAKGHDHGHKHDHDHADVRALVDVNCKQSLEGSTLRFAVKRFFPEAETLRVQVVGANFQTGAELKGNRNSIQLSR